MKPLPFLLFLLTVTAAAAVPDFHKDVAPILREYCAGCHNDDELDGEFSVETFKSLMSGGDSGNCGGYDVGGRTPARGPFDSARKRGG